MTYGAVCVIKNTTYAGRQLVNISCNNRAFRWEWNVINEPPRIVPTEPRDWVAMSVLFLMAQKYETQYLYVAYKYIS